MKRYFLLILSICLSSAQYAHAQGNEKIGPGVCADASMGYYNVPQVGSE